MPPVFAQVDLSELGTLLVHFPFRRRIDTVHVHHTWRPTREQYRGHDTIEGMWRYHTVERGWDDIAQHLTIGPAGELWLGRNWNSPPASATGYNGNLDTGPFMIEVIGDFDRERLEGPQLEALVDVVALVRKRFELPAESLRFHREMSNKTCPGTNVDRADLLARVAERVETVDLQERAADESSRFGARALRVHDHITALTRIEPSAVPAGELEEQGIPPLVEESRSVQVRDAFTPAVKAALRPYVINLRQGRFSTGGLFDTDQGDVDAIFGEHLPRAVEEARRDGEPLRVVFYAHGGLVSERNALRRAANDVPWWRANGVYPIFFVWETGLFETLGQMLQRAGERLGLVTARDIFDFTTDRLVEELARSLYGPSIWSAMKFSAERASSVADGGGAAYAAGRLAAFLAAGGDGKGKTPADVDLHAVGHSAGSNFLGHFLPRVTSETKARFKTVQLMAPAMRVDQFKASLAPLVNAADSKPGIDGLTIYTMGKDYERDDDCMGVYRKSLLYLIHNALEPEGRGVPILGLEESLRDDADLRSLFGLAVRGGGGDAEVVFSVTNTQDGRRASVATTHSGFASDPVTMNSVVRGVLSRDGDDEVVSYPSMAARGGRDEWGDQVDWPEWAPEPPPRPVATSGATSSLPLGVTPVRRDEASGRLHALCIGIDQYADAPLYGCVRDAELWGSTLQSLGFAQPTVLLNGDATRDGILRAFDRLVRNASAGDVIVYQFAGHGTQVPDVEGDEDDDLDEAFCPVDLDSGSFLTDDDFREVTWRLSDGVNLTSFVDCCHSGTINRVLGRTPPRARGARVRARYLRATEEMKDRHRAFRARLGRTASRSVGGMPPGVLFAACQADELAYETDGQGDFTLRATRLLVNGALGQPHETFERLLVAEFGADRRHTPRFDGREESKTAPLLQPLTTGGGASPPPRSQAAMATELRRIADRLDRGMP